MWRLRTAVPGLLLCLAFAGCGGGGSAPQTANPQDFAITLSSASLSLAQGASSSPLTVSISGQNGFAGSVQVTLSSLPSGVSSNPASPFSVVAGASTSIIFGATANAGTGNFTISAQGASGSLSHSANLALSVQSATIAALPRTTYTRTDSLNIFDEPPGEPRHRRIAYDSANKHVFIANRAMNRVEVFSSTDQTRLAQISVPGASSADISADGTTIWVGTLTEQAAAIDAASLQVRTRYTIPPLLPVPNTVFDRPEELLSLASGKLLIRLRQPSSTEALLALWDPNSNALTNLTSLASALFQNGVGSMARSADHTKVLVAANDSSGELALFDSNANVIAGPHALGAGTIPLVAANADGSHFAVAFVSGAASRVLLLDGSLNSIASQASISAQGLAFSRDGNFLYASVSSTAASAISVFDGRTLQFLGQVPDASIQAVHSEIEDADETQLLFGIANHGISFIDAAHPASLPSTVPAFAPAPAALPSEGPAVGGTSTSLSGQNFEPPAQIKFGSQAAAAVTATSTSQIQATSPPSVVNGGVNVSAYFPSGWLAIAPDAFSYGPQILEILPNAGAKSGNDTVQIYGYGFGADAGKISVTIGGSAAAVQKVENVTSIAGSLGLDATFPFSLERITLQTPAGNSGKSAISITSASGTTTQTSAFQYLQSVQTYAKPGLYKFLLYDQGRQWLYLSNIDHVDVFDLAAAQFHTTGINPPGGPPPNAGLRGLSLTPDGTQLAVADFGAQKIYLLNPDTGAGSAVSVGGVPGFAASGPARVAATSAQTVFVGLSGEGGTSGACAACLEQLNLTASPPAIQPAPQPEVTSITGAPLLQGTPSGDHVFLAFANASGGPLGIWDAASPNHFTTSSATISATDLAAASDGTALAARANGGTEIRGSDLALTGTPVAPELEQLSGRVAVPGVAVHPSGALIYQPFLTGPAPAAPAASGIRGGVDIFDAHSGRLRLRIFLPEPFAALSTDTDGLRGDFLAVDENGQRLFALTTSGLTVVQLASVPLGIGTLSASAGTAAGGTAITIRGSGFQSGATVTLGGKSAATTFKDMNTLNIVTPALSPGPQRMVITNPDGEAIALDAAFAAK